MNASIESEDSFEQRARALDRLEFLEQEPQVTALRERLERIDARLFARLRGDIRDGRLRGPELLNSIHRLVPSAANPGIGYDALDSLMIGLLLTRPVPEQTFVLDKEMVPYQRTPSRVVLDMVRRARFDPNDTFYDLGSGLGEVAIVVHLLTGVRAKGIEIEPRYCDYARAIAADLNLSGVHFVNQDVRDADLSNGTAFYLHTPFTGSILAAVLEELRRVAERHPLTLFAYGPCTAEIAEFRSR